MKIVIDRFEGNFAIVELENGKMESIPKSILPSNAKESDIILITISEEETKEKKENINKLVNDLFV